MAALLTAALIPLNALAGEDRSYDTYANQALTATQAILVDAGKCSDINDCTRKQYAFFAPTSEGISLHFYGITEEATVQRIFGMLAQQFYRLPRGSSLHARFITSTKEVDLKRSFFRPVPVFAEIHMQSTSHGPNN
jgi:hypothetical protein